MISSPALLELWLVQRARDGDKKAFGQLYDRNVGRVYGLLRRLTGSAEAAEDLTQDTFVAAYTSLTQWRAQGKFSTWLCGIAARQYASNRRLAWREPATEAYDADEDAPFLASNVEDPLAHCTRREAEVALESAIADLPTAIRSVFVLVRVEGMRYHEAADLLNIPLGTVQSRLNRAHILLRERLAYLYRDNLIAAPLSQKEPGHVIR